MRRVVSKLIKSGKTISTMESCTGGALVNAITNIEGASEVLKFSSVTYSNLFKIKMGVDEKVIEEYSVYSMNVAMEMSKNCSLFADSNYGVGITGKLNRADSNNLYGNDNQVFISIYFKDLDKFYNYDMRVLFKTREKCKDEIVSFIIDRLLEVL